MQVQVFAMQFDSIGAIRDTWLVETFDNKSDAYTLTYELNQKETSTDTIYYWYYS